MDEVIDRFAGRVLIVAPHMDDEVLACGGLVACLRGKAEVHVVYATDGTMSPIPTFPARGTSPPDLGPLRRKESTEAMALLGVAESHLHFLGLPEARLETCTPKLQRLLLDQFDRLQPDHVLAPFRFDRHPDHLAVNRAATDALLEDRLQGRLWEYFVYHRWRLLPGGNVRRFLRPDRIVELDISGVAALKRAALDCFRSQTTLYYPWQTRPILTSSLLDEECAGPEYFLAYDADRPGTRVFSRARSWIRVAHWLEPKLQKWKYLVASALQASVGRGH